MNKITLVLSDTTSVSYIVLSRAGSERLSWLGSSLTKTGSPSNSRSLHSLGDYQDQIDFERLPRYSFGSFCEQAK